MGLKTAKYDYVLLSDADCRADSENWIKQMVTSFSEKDIVLGFGAYQKKKGPGSRWGPHHQKDVMCCAFIRDG